MKGNAINFQKFVLVVLVQPWVVDAHPLHWSSESMGFLSGFSHPLTSPDHILTMLAVGLWLAQIGRRATYFLPMVFVALMLMGGGLTLLPIGIAHAEDVMNCLVLMLGLMLVGFKVSPPLGALIVSTLAVFHGYVHAYDMMLDVYAFAYTTGFALASSVLIALGISFCRLLNCLNLKYSLNLSAKR